MTETVPRTSGDRWWQSGWVVGVALLAAAAIPLVIAMASAAGSSAPKTGYGGQYPSAAAQAYVGGLKGQTFEAGALGPGAWTVDAFAVVPNQVSAGGKGPIVMVRQGKLRRSIPAYTDGDIADLARRVKGTDESGLATETSPLYRRVMGM